MGTNYYTTSKKERIHIGKASGGWCFSLHVYPELGINTFEDWLCILARRKSNGKLPKIIDDYGVRYTLSEFVDIVCNRRMEEPESLVWLARNGGVHGPNNLARHAISGTCIGQGVGTWDYIVGDFS